MTPPAAAPASLKTDRAPSPEAVLLESLALAGESLTDAIVRHDLDAIVAATREAEILMARLTTRDAVRHAADFDAAERVAAERLAADRRPHPAPDPAAPDPVVLRLGSRIGATARRNALLLEHAWATDATLLRLLATAARAEVAASSGTGYAQPTPDAQPAGWLDRSA